VVHPAGHDFQAVGNDFARYQAIAHALVAHHDPVRGGRRAEYLGHTAGSADALTCVAGEAVQMGVARRDVAEKRGNPNHGAVEIVVMESHGPKHGAIRSAAHALGS